MTTFKSMPRHYLATGGLVLLVLTGFIIDLGVISPKLNRAAQLSNERVELENRLGTAMSSRFRKGDAQRGLRVEDLDSYLSGDGEDLVSYIGRQIDEAGLMRLDLSTVDELQSTHIKTTKFNVRVSGNYNEIVKFVQAMESNPRLAEFHNFVIQTPLAGKNIEGRFNLSIYDPNTGQ